jgi:anti-anti-sigma regulatory factor
MKLLNLQKRVNDLMQITKLVTVFETYTSEEAALRSFAKKK